MCILTPQIIAEVTHGRYVGSDEERNIQIIGAVHDSRDVSSGNLFVCIQGERTDGHLYAQTAYDSGAVCCLTERELPSIDKPYVIVDSTLEAIKTLGEFHRSQFNIPIIGITGSTGKTTAKELIASALEAKLCVLKTTGNLNNELGVPLMLLSLNANHEAAVIEMGISDFGEMSRLAEMVRPTIFVITQIGYSHIKELGDLRGVLRAKTEAAPYIKQDGIIILNGDDELLRDYETGLKKITFGQGKNNDFYSESVESNGTESISMNIVHNDERCPIDIPAYGVHFASLAPAAVAVSKLLGLTDEDIYKGLQSYAPVGGRSNVSNINGITLVDDSYNANPSSVKAALQSLSQLPGRRIAILGDMLNLGTLSAELHFDTGKIAAECGIDLLLCHGDESHQIYNGYKDNGGSSAECYTLFDKLTADIANKIKKGDAVLVKASRGMHFERLITNLTSLFNR